jgi:RHS repeat-associated protein
LGNIRVSYTLNPADGQLKILEENHYYPFGLKHSNYNVDKADFEKDETGFFAILKPVERSEFQYKYNGKEFQDELNLNWYDYQARNYDPALGRWLSIDPKAHLRSWMSPYNFVQNNPINRVDPDGALDAPIYDTEGEFLGTDDEGLQGKAIVMNKSDFTQGMSHKDALGKNLGVGGLNGDGAKTKLLDNYNGLKDRPDYDGKLTFGEATKWSNQGGGKPLFVDGSKIDLSPKTVSDVSNAAKNNNGYIDFFSDGQGDYNTGRVYGNIKVILSNEKTGGVRLGGKNGLLDVHDFKNPVFKTINDYLSPGTPRDFKIYCAPCNSKVGTE